MKRLILIIFPLACAAQEYTAKICRVGLDAEIMHLSVIGDNFVKGPSGVIYRASWGPTQVPNSATHTNITVVQLPDLAAQLPTIGKSVAISGITDPQAFMTAFGLVRCAENGNPIPQEETP
jgi:hypothetical protein